MVYDEKLSTKEICICTLEKWLPENNICYISKGLNILNNKTAQPMHVFIEVGQ